MAAATYLGPSSFDGDRLVFTLPPAPAKKTLVAIVPGLSSGAWRADPTTVSSHVEVDIQVTPSENVPAFSGQVLPVPKRLTPSVLDNPRSGTAADLPEIRPFSIYSGKQHAYVTTTGHKAYVGATYAFYEDDANTTNLTTEEYAALNEIADQWYPKLTSLLGTPTDLDGNGHHIVFFSETAVKERQGLGQAYVDGCNFSNSPAACSGAGEIINLWSLAGFTDATVRRAYYVQDYFPRTILHETVHLAQYANGFRRLGKYVPFHAPLHLIEGPAEQIRFISGLGRSETWDHVKSELGSSAPFTEPYYLGSVFVWWLRGLAGDGVHQALLDALVDDTTPPRDLIEHGVGVPEPLALAMMYASLRLDGTELGSATHLEFPDDDVPTLLGNSLEVTLLAETDTAHATLGYTAGQIFELSHSHPVQVTIAVPDAARAFVVVAQP